MRLVSPYSNDKYTVGWICALHDERIAYKLMLDKEHGRPQWQHPNDHNVYCLGEIGGHRIVMAGLPQGEYGTNSANTVAAHLTMSFLNIKYGLMVGIGGGVPGHDEHDIRLGDVVVGCAVGQSGGIVHYNKGKVQQDGFKRVGQMNRPPQQLLNAVAHLRTDVATSTLYRKTILPAIGDRIGEVNGIQGRLDLLKYQGADNDVLFELDYPHQSGLLCASAGDSEGHQDNDMNVGEPTVNTATGCGRCDLARQVFRPKRNTEDPHVHYGVIASGDWVVKNAEERERIRKEHQALCIEMEAAGLQNFPSLIIRGISDYADSHKNNRWQQYAALTAAAYAKELLHSIVPRSETAMIITQSWMTITSHTQSSPRPAARAPHTSPLLEARPTQSSPLLQVSTGTASSEIRPSSVSDAFRRAAERSGSCDEYARGAKRSRSTGDFRASAISPVSSSAGRIFAVDDSCQPIGQTFGIATLEASQSRMLSDRDTVPSMFPPHKPYPPVPTRQYHPCTPRDHYDDIALRRIATADHTTLKVSMLRVQGSWNTKSSDTTGS
ncbi:purine and uridine phosphorylase [Ascobolus immersus RN42]|uniref:Purine and uridine phosphorylase n=1 Tax=Ascobolus immersus RN42 TaxID=1160509 RepID=A0A3N4I8V8_ASCIM|nr:purine and uridine phosphorylase [Ascobolus immersus RN42]